MELTTATAPRRQPWWRRVALLMAALVACLGTVTAVAPSPAQAATSETYCFPMWVKTPGGWWVYKMICIEIPYAYDPNPCCIWDYGIDLAVDVVLPKDHELDYLRDLTTGLGLLAQAALADPRTAAVLRGRAQESFVSAARTLGTATVRLNQVGVVDVEKLTFEPAPLPWLAAAGADIADGLAFTQRGATREGMGEFEAAVAGLTAKH